MPRGLVLVDHGSRRAEANAVVEAIALALRARGEAIVRHAHMELAAPSLADAIDDAVAAGADAIVVMPYFLGPGRHVSEDVPRLAEAALAKHPGVTLRVAAPLGVHPLLVDLVLARCAD